MRAMDVSYLGGALLTSLLSKVLDLDQELSALLIEVEEII